MTDGLIVKIEKLFLASINIGHFIYSTLEKIEILQLQNLFLLHIVLVLINYFLKRNSINSLQMKLYC